MMLSWISLVPPSMELARERSHVARARELARGEALAFPAEPLIAEDLHHELAAALVQLGAVELEHRRLGAGPRPASAASAERRSVILLQ